MSRTKNFGRLTIAIMAVICTFQMPRANAGNDKDKLVFDIAADIASCVGVAPMQCLVINGDFFYENIVGYQHIEGQAAKICVLRTKRPEPVPADLGAFVFTRVPCED